MKSALITFALTASTLGVAPALAQSDNWVGEIRTFAGSYCPAGWADTDGRSMSIAQNAPLFALLGTTYGGDGRTTFNLPKVTAGTDVAALPAPAPTQQVELYSDCNFQGGKATLPPGNYASAQMPAAVPSRTLSSMKIPPGMSVKVYDGANLDGQTVQFSDNRACLVQDGFNDRTVSLKVIGAPAAAPAAASRIPMKSCIALQGLFPPRP